MNRREFLATGASTLAGWAALQRFNQLNALVATSAQLPARMQVLAAIRLVNDHWINGHADPGNNGWARATYFRGNIAAYEATGDAAYLEYAQSWARNHNFGLIGGAATRNANNQAAGEVYIKLFELEKNTSDLTEINTSLRNMINSAASDDWSWVDAVNMSMPSFALLGSINNDVSYYSKMYDLYHHTKTITGGPGLFDPSLHLWFRDHKYLPPRTGPDGKPILWSRGNGWAFAAHAKVLAVLPPSNPHYPEILGTFVEMASALAEAQRSDGFWNVDLGDPHDFEGPETSGTSLFVFGIAWGINAGILSARTYLPAVTKGWNGLVKTAVQPSGFLGFVQGTGEQPASSQPVTATSTADFGVGAFLLAAQQVAKLA